MNIIERAVRARGSSARRDRTGIVYVADSIDVAQLEARPESDMFSVAWRQLQRWMCRATQPTNTIMTLVESLAEVRYVNGYDALGRETSNGLMANPENIVVRDALPFAREWSEVELVVERVKSPRPLLAAIEGGLPMPAWMLKNRWGEIEAGWFVFRPNSLITIFDPKSRAESKGAQQKTGRAVVFEDEAALLAEARGWKAQLREVIGAEPMEYSARRAGLENTYTYPLSPGTELLLLNTISPARSRSRFATLVTEAAQHPGGQVTARYEAQRRRGESPKRSSSVANLERANTVRAQLVETRMRRLCELRHDDRELTQTACARALGCDPRTVRNYLREPGFCTPPEKSDPNRGPWECGACWNS